MPPKTPEELQQLERGIAFFDVQEQQAMEDEHGLARVLMRLMDTDPESNVVFGNIPPGEAEDYAAAVAFAEFTGSPVMLRYENLRNMAKRAEKGALLDKILKAVTAIGKAPSEPKAGFFNRLKRT